MIVVLIFVLGIVIGDIIIWGIIFILGLVLVVFVGIVLNKILLEDK